MVEKEIQRGKEAEVPSLTHYDEPTQRLERANERARKGTRGIKGKSKSWEINRQGIIHRYASIEDPKLANNNWTIFCNEVSQHSGLHRHPCGRHLSKLRQRHEFYQ